MICKKKYSDTFHKLFRYLVHSEQLLNGMKDTPMVLLVSSFGVSETVDSFLWLIHGCNVSHDIECLKHLLQHTFTLLVSNGSISLNTPSNVTNIHFWSIRSWVCGVCIL